ncbi:MAG TPA: class I SAM-dependent methyltransferase [Armatimonadota bacterium]|nr:class I SAM-dependent methyltransferase [Armatimonadota bacterium]
MYDAKKVREHFEKWGHEGLEGDPGHPTSRWTVPHVNHMILDRWLPTQGAVLDAGCGLGIEAVKMARRGLAVTALDISRSLLEHARHRADRAGVMDRITFVQADLTETLPFVGQPFNVCTALTGVVSHTNTRHRQAVTNLTACCVPGGLVIVGVDSYYGKIRQYLQSGMIEEAELLGDTRLTCTVSDTFADYCFTPVELAGLFADLGCRCEEMFAAPTVAAYGYVGVPDDAFARALDLERRFLGTPELLGTGEQIVAVFRKE